MIKQLARYILRDERAAIHAENKYLYQKAITADQRWVELNAVMAHRAQQERGLFCVKQGKKHLPILAVRTVPGSVWEITVE